MTFKVENYKELVKARPTDETGIWAPRTALVGDDGVRLAEVGSGREGQSYFIYTDRDISFELTALNCYYEGGPQWEYWDYWEVDLGPALETYSPSSDGPVNLKKARGIARNIEEALMAWPRYPSQPAIRQVKFLMKYWQQWNPAWGDWAMSPADIPEANSPSS